MNRDFHQVNNPLYRQNRNKHVQKMSLTEALTSNPRFNTLKESGSPHHKQINRQIEYDTKPVSNFQKNNKLSEMLMRKNITGLSGIPTRKISIKELTNKKSILHRQKKKVQNKQGLQNMLKK